MVVSLALSACARPTVEGAPFMAEPDEPEVGEQPVREAGAAGELDAGPQQPSPRDTGAPSEEQVHDAAAPAQEAGHEPCADGDHDSVCDDSDNCPDVANTTQADGDQDGQGDACEPDTGAPAAACNAEAVPAMGMAGDGLLSNVRVNGMSASSPVHVRRGQRLSVTIGYTFEECGLIPLPGQPRFMTIGLDGARDGTCQILIEVPCPARASSEVTMMIDAPNTVGPAYIVALGRQGFVCSDSLNNARRVAALCVE